MLLIQVTESNKSVEADLWGPRIFQSLYLFERSLPCQSTVAAPTSGSLLRSVTNMASQKLLFIEIESNLIL